VLPPLLLASLLELCCTSGTRLGADTEALRCGPRRAKAKEQRDAKARQQECTNSACANCRGAGKPQQRGKGGRAAGQPPATRAKRRAQAQGGRGEAAKRARLAAAGTCMPAAAPDTAPAAAPPAAEGGLHVAGALEPWPLAEHWAALRAHIMACMAQGGEERRMAQAMLLQIREVELDLLLRTPEDPQLLQALRP
jgi:hypothetical protein